MINKIQSSEPIVVGGVGGSGTRVIAQILREAGFFIGNDLNEAKDNLLFTLLFKRPKWFIKNLNKNRSEVFKGLSIFEKSMTGTLDIQHDELKFIMNAVVGMAFRGNNYLGANRGLWPIWRFLKMLRSKHIDSTAYVGWGWKEPNSHIYIEYLSKYFPKMKFILTIRHGIDMAYSKNQQQFYNWCGYFGIEIPETDNLLPKAALNYWIKANHRAIALGRDLLGKRFLVINFDEMCYLPRENVEKLIRFLGFDVESVDISRLCNLIKKPQSIGRYKTHDLGIFEKREISEVENLGFKVRYHRS